MAAPERVGQSEDWDEAVVRGGQHRLVPAVSVDVDELLSRLRATGFAPIPENADCVVIVPERVAPSAPAMPRPQARNRMAAAALVTRRPPSGGTG